VEGGSQRQYSLNDFELIKVIGRGSYAKVLMVELKKTGRIYAMKVIKKALVTDDEVVSVYTSFIILSVEKLLLSSGKYA
jgi:serine/threonine protein kinase